MIKNKLKTAAHLVGIKKIGIAKIGDVTAIVALFPYYVSDEIGNIAMYARSRDYHKVNTEKLEVLCNVLRENGATECKIYVDNAARNDRNAAYLAGLGFYGRNNLLICDEFGSYFTIGQIETDLEIGADNPLTATCCDCKKCITACPSGALDDGIFSKLLCMSEISQKKGELTEQEAELLRHVGTAWGCDVCQQVCPHNIDLITTASTELINNRIAALSLSDIEHLSNAEFRKKYADYAFSWRNVDVVKRNLRIISQSNLNV